MYIRVHAFPGARKERVVRDDEGVYTIAVKEPAERNMANTRIREILANELGVPLQEVRILTGHRSPSKLFVVQ
jgi:hypothetical protein